MEMTAVEDPGWQEITPKYKHVFRQKESLLPSPVEKVQPPVLGGQKSKQTVTPKLQGWQEVRVTRV